MLSTARTVSHCAGRPNSGEGRQRGVWPLRNMETARLGRLSWSMMQELARGCDRWRRTAIISGRPTGLAPAQTLRSPALLVCLRAPRRVESSRLDASPSGPERHATRLGSVLACDCSPQPHRVCRQLGRDGKAATAASASDSIVWARPGPAAGAAPVSHGTNGSQEHTQAEVAIPVAVQPGSSGGGGRVLLQGDRH